MNECILVVDDDREIVGAIAIVLEREGYTVRRAYDGLGAVEQALDPAVRLILIDVMMPKLDGLSALMRIREKRNLPVIVLSAKSPIILRSWPPGYGASCAATPCWEMFMRRSVRARLSTDACPMTRSAVN